MRSFYVFASLTACVGFGNLAFSKQDIVGAIFVRSVIDEHLPMGPDAPVTYFGVARYTNSSDYLYSCRVRSFEDPSYHVGASIEIYEAAGSLRYVGNLRYGIDPNERSVRNWNHDYHNDEGVESHFFTSILRPHPLDREVTLNLVTYRDAGRKIVVLTYKGDSRRGPSYTCKFENSNSR